MSAHDISDDPPSINPLATTPAFIDSSSINDVESDDHHEQAQLREGNMATPDSLNSDSASETLVYIEHPLQYSPTHSNPDRFSPYNYSSGSCDWHRTSISIHLYFCDPLRQFNLATTLSRGDRYRSESRPAPSLERFYHCSLLHLLPLRLAARHR